MIPSTFDVVNVRQTYGQINSFQSSTSPEMPRAQRNAGERAIADFMMDLTEVQTPALVIYEDKALRALHLASGVFSERVHLISTAAYLRKLEAHGYIGSFDEIWENIVAANANSNPRLHRVPRSKTQQPAAGRPC